MLIWTSYSPSSIEMKEERFVVDEVDVKQLQVDLNVLKHEMERMNILVGQGHGYTYIRWGRTTCPMNGTEFIYKGYMAGDKWNQPGGGANNLCIPEIPSWGNYVDGYDGGSEIRGTEIEDTSGVSNKLFGKETNNHDIPCAVCRSMRASHVMIPGRTSCYTGWTEEYSGYVVASNPTWAANSDYVCLDSGLEFVTHGAGNDDEHVVNLVEVRCGSLPCPPYVDGRELACVVCTK